MTGLFSCTQLRAEIDRALTDSLCNVLKNTKDPAQKLPVLLYLSQLYWQKPEEASYLKELVDLSTELDSLNYVYDGYSKLCRY